MAIYPKVQSPCPYKGDLSAIMDGDVCRLCKREVFDLTHMSDDERVIFMENCTSEVCVTYRFPVKPMLAAAVVAAAVAIPVAAAACDATTETVVFVGGIKDPAHTQWVQNAGDRSIPALPVVYESQASAPGQAANASNSAPPEMPVNSREPS
jgi:predicted Fe-S protein YdhL (DUF1289 family)